MKSIIAVMIFFFSSTALLHAQEYDSIPPYQKDSTIPDFSIMQTDSSWFVKEFLPPNKPVIIIYFSPDCGHCQLTAHDFEKKMNKLKDVFFVWVSYLSLDKIKTFAEEYKMDDQKNIRIGRDPNYYIPSFYRVKFTPFIAVYDKKGKLLKTYDEGTDPDTIINLLNLKKS